jgi:tripartite-type tricarboxylate transporter receptor subunit TctC
MLRLPLARRALCAAMLLTLSGGLAAQIGADPAPDFPGKPVRIIVNSGPGVSTDALARMIGAHLATVWKQPVIVENKPGASGTLGADFVAKSPADGLTLLLGVTNLVQTPFLMRKLPYDFLRDLQPVSMLARGPNALVVPASSPANTLAEFVTMVKSQPAKHGYGTYGQGTTAHIWGDAFRRQAGLDLVHVPFKSSAQMLTDVMGGQVSSAVPDLASAMSLIRDGKLKVLAVSGAQRHQGLPQAPTFGELGYAGLEPYGWYGVFTPAGTPAAVVHKLSAAWVAAVKTAPIHARMTDMGLIPAADSAEVFAATLQSDAPVWARAIREGGIQLD